LHKSGFESVLVLEGSDRVGGRILTEYLDKDSSKPLEMGACWMHGIQGNPVYELAKQEKFPNHTGTILSFDIGTCVDENGSQISSELHNEVDQFFESLLQDTRNLFEFQTHHQQQLSSASIQKVFLEKFDNFLNLNGSDSETRRLKLKLLQRR
jgi:monoamine oxidase